MPKLAPISRPDLIRRMREFGFEGPFSGGKHQYLLNGDLRLTIPNPHRAAIGTGLLRRILQQAGISPDEWLKPR